MKRPDQCNGKQNILDTILTRKDNWMKHIMMRGILITLVDGIVMVEKRDEGGV